MQRLGKKLGLIISCENLDAHFQAPPGLEGFRLRWVVFTNLECRIAISHIIAAVTSSGPGPSNRGLRRQKVVEAILIYGAGHLGWLQQDFASNPDFRLRKLAEFQEAGGSR